MGDGVDVGVAVGLGVGFGVGFGGPPVHVLIAPLRHSHSRGDSPDRWIRSAMSRPKYRKCHGSYL